MDLCMCVCIQYIFEILFKRFRVLFRSIFGFFVCVKLKNAFGFLKKKKVGKISVDSETEDFDNLFYN